MRLVSTICSSLSLYMIYHIVREACIHRNVNLKGHLKHYLVIVITF